MLLLSKMLKLLAILVSINYSQSFRPLGSKKIAVNSQFKFALRPQLSLPNSDNSIPSSFPATINSDQNSNALPDANTEEPIESDEERYKREKLQEIAERKAAEVFVTRDTGKFECQACGYIYSVAEGMPKKGIKPGTPWDEIESIRCPQCGASKKYFVAETETLSGFKENLKYGLGGNAMTSGQKSNLIFGGLALFFILFLSGYLLE